MKSGWAMVTAAILVVVAFVLDVGLGRSLTIGGVRPNLTIAMLVPVALATRSTAAAWLGLVAGLMEGSFVSLAVGSYAVSRAFTGWSVGLLEQRLFRDSMVVTAAAGFLGSLIADVAFFLLAPQPEPGHYALTMLWRALYTGALVVPLGLLVRRLLPDRS